VEKKSIVKIRAQNAIRCSLSFSEIRKGKEDRTKNTKGCLPVARSLNAISTLLSLLYLLLVWTLTNLQSTI
jgi:hypothetical protein